MQWSLVKKFRIIVNHHKQLPHPADLQGACRAAAFAVLLTGCSLLPSGMRTGEAVPDPGPAIHTRFVETNLALLNRIYAKRYEPCDFIVDTDSGSTAVQNLIDLKAAQRIRQSLPLRNLSETAEIKALLAYLHSGYRYISEPQPWMPVGETIRRKSGDCKNLSLLLLSLLAAGGMEAYGGVSNGHMWVHTLAEGQWVVLETDPNPSGDAVYRIPGFYSDPLFKIYPEYSLKRSRIASPS